MSFEIHEPKRELRECMFRLPVKMVREIDYLKDLHGVSRVQIVTQMIEHCLKDLRKRENEQ